MPDVAMSSTSRHEDPALLKAVQVGLAKARRDGEHYQDRLCAEHVAAALTDYGLILPVGVTIGAVYGVFRGGVGDDGYQFTDLAEARRWARDGGTDGRSGEVRTAWRIQADGVDVITTWKRAGSG